MAWIALAGAWADNINAGDITLQAGETKTVNISLTNTESNLVSFQMDLTLPEGISINKAGCSLSNRISDPDQELTIGKQDNNVYRIASASFSLTPISGTSGTLLTLSLTASDNSAGGTATLSNILFVTNNSERVTIEDASFNIYFPVTITANSYTIKYGDDIPEFGFTSEGADLVGTPAITCEATSSSPVGTYPIVISKGTVENYNDTYVNGTLTIEKAPLTITAKSYTRKQGEENPTFEAEYEGFKNNETSSVLTKQPVFSCDATAASAPGEYDITVSGAEAQNYEISYVSGKLTVIDADAVIITANSYTIKYGDDMPDFGFTSEGADLVGTPAITCEATTASPVGTYPIVISKGTVENYNDTYVNGTLTIEKAPLTITAKSYTRKQGEENPTFEAQYEGFKNNETSSVLTKQPVFSCDATEASEPGEYDITVSGAEAQNYKISYVSGKLTVIDADPVTITANSYTIKYGDDIPDFGFTSEGADLVGTPAITCEATSASPVGTYPIVISKGSVENYNDTYVNGTLTIEKAPLTITAKSYTRKQGEENPTFEAQYEGFKNNETSSVLTKQPVFSCDATEASEPGEYDITVSGAEAQNYKMSYVKGKLTVTAADPVTITANSYTIKYGDDIPEFGFTSEGADLVGTPAITCEATSSSPVGTYPIVITKGTVENYNDTYVNGTLTIEKAPLTITAKSYTRKQGEENPTFEAEYEGFKNNETSSVLTKQPTFACTATAASAPGEYDITVAGAEAQNYEMSYVKGKLTVTAADPVTITANSYTIKYGDDMPEFGFTSEGADLVGTPAITCEATSSSPVGTYPIVITKGTVENYNDTYVNGTLTIEKAPLTITAKSYTRKQGEENPTFEADYEGFKNNETSSVLTKQPVFTCTATAASAPGEYDITVSGAEAQNYEISYVSGVLTVEQVTGIGRIFVDGKRVDVYSISGVLYKKDVVSPNELPQGIYIINGKKYVVK